MLWCVQDRHLSIMVVNLIFLCTVNVRKITLGFPRADICLKVFFFLMRLYSGVAYFLMGEVLFSEGVFFLRCGEDLYLEGLFSGNAWFRYVFI